MTHPVSDKNQQKETSSWTYFDENLIFHGYKITGRMKTFQIMKMKKT